MKLCTDCKHCRINGWPVGRLCGRPPKLSRVTGHAHVSCASEREEEETSCGRVEGVDHTKCGREGKYWEEKETPAFTPPTTLWEKIKFLFNT